MSFVSNRRDISGERQATEEEGQATEEEGHLISHVLRNLVEHEHFLERKYRSKIMA